MTTSLLVFDTSLGSIEIDVHDAAAPLTARYVRRLVDAGHFDGAAFYRSTTLGAEGRDRLIQGGPLAPLFMGSDTAIPHLVLLETVESTTLTGLAHRRGTVSLARDLVTTGHVLPEIFVCLDDYPELDAGGRTDPDAAGFPAFGVVTGGLEVVAAIAAGETAGDSPVERLVGEILTDPIPIASAAFAAPTTKNRT